jgi:hypothetical protein
MDTTIFLRFFMVSPLERWLIYLYKSFGLGKDWLKNLGFQPPYPQLLTFFLNARGDKIYKIHSSEFRCRLSLRWKMDESSAA